MYIKEKKDMNNAESNFKDALVAMLNNQQLDTIKISKLIQTAGYCRSTFYIYYTSVYDLYENLVEELLAPIKKLEDRRDMNSCEKFSILYKIIEESQEAFKAVMKEEGKADYFSNRLKMYIAQFLKNDSSFQAENNVYQEFLVTTIYNLVRIYLKSKEGFYPEILDMYTQQLLITTSYIKVRKNVHN